MIRLVRPPPPAPHPFKTYKDAHVVAALNGMFRSKCAYCESRVTATGPTDVEHYRPKGRVLEPNGKTRKGYRWLELEWTNLLPSCIDCNRERRQPLIGPGAAVIAGKGGKASYFPLRNPAARAKKKGQEKLERPLLLNPCDDPDDPESLLVFTDNGSIRATAAAPSTDRALSTIDVMGLHRAGLVEWRRNRLQELELQMQEVCKFAFRALEDPANPVHKKDRADALTRLRGMADPPNDYVAMAKQVVRHFETVLGLLERYFAVQISLRARPAGGQLRKAEADLLTELAVFSNPDHPFQRLTRRLQEYLFGTLPV
jgi:hypothetical protein